MKSTSVILSTTAFLALMLAVAGVMLMLASRAPRTANGQSPATNTSVVIAQAATTTNTLSPATSPTSASTLRPAPTFEPPTSTPLPLPTLQLMASPTLGINVDLPELHGLETPTPTVESCEPRKEWLLIYTVREGDAIARIAQTYGTYAADLALGNCLSDANVIRVGQTLRVPGDAHPVTPEWMCAPWEVLTPIDHAFDIAENGQLTFNWRGSAGRRNLIRVFDANGALFWERTVDLRQNESINLGAEAFEPGNYSWQIYPLDMNFQQIPCTESPTWHFNIGSRPDTAPTAP